MVSQVMDDIGASVEIRDRYIESTTLDEIILSFQAKWTAGSVYTCGSKMEGTRTNGMQSDTDIVIVQESLPAITNIGDAKDHKLCFLIVQDATTPAGYVKLQRVIDGIPQFKSPVPLQFSGSRCLRFDNEGRELLYTLKSFSNTHKFVQRHGPTISSRPTMFGAAKRPVPMQCSGSGCLFFCDEDRVLLDTSQCLLDIPEFVERHGPAMSSKPTMFGAAIDLVPAIRCRSFPECAQKWITRKRHPGWSGSDLINMCKSLGCFFVRVGHPNSPEMDSQWRISFSLQERLFVTHFNSTQLHCYVLLKLIKKEIIVKLLQKECITSYHCKTCMLYMIENTPVSFWTEENLLVCLHNCLKLILQWVKEGICPNYFIPEENMFDGRVNDIVRSRLCRVLTDLISAHFGFLLSINSDQFGLRLDSMLKGTMLSKEYLWNYLNFMKTILVLGTVHHALALHVCIMDQIKENDSHTALNGTLSRMMEFKQHTDNGTEHTFEETTRALSLTEPYVEMSLMSMTIAYVNSTQGSTKTTYNAMISDRWNEIGSTSDAFSAKLKQACLLHMSGYSVVSLDLLLSLESKMNSKVVSICRCSSAESHFPSLV